MNVLQQSGTANAPANQELKEQIRNSIRDATEAARDAAQAQRDAAIAQRDAARLGIPVVPPVPRNYVVGDIPPRIEGVAYGFFTMCVLIVIGWPLARAIGRRIDRQPSSPALNPQVSDQLQRIEQAVEAMAIEVERISESQRFMARLQSAQTPAQSAVEPR